MPQLKGIPQWQAVFFRRFGNEWYEVVSAKQPDGSIKLQLGENKMPALLQFIDEQIEKARTERKRAVKEKKPKYIPVKCSYCGHDKQVPVREYKDKHRRGSKELYCSNKCYQEANSTFLDRIR